MDYRGSYRELKKFMSGNSDGELSFLRIFLKELFQDKLIYDFVFEIYFMDDNETLIQEELERVIKHNYYTFEADILLFRASIIITFSLFAILSSLNRRLTLCSSLSVKYKITDIYLSVSFAFA